MLDTLPTYAYMNCCYIPLYNPVEGTIYLKAQLTNKENLSCKDVQFVLKGKLCIHSSL